MSQQANQPDDPLAAFLGRWRLMRRIAHPAYSAPLRFEGVLDIWADGEDAIAEEAGWLALPGQPPIRASRRNVWRAAGSRIEVRFADGRRFHDFDPAAPQTLVEHHCPPDRYRGAYDFSAWPRWRLSWEATGPRKAWRSETEAVRDLGSEGRLVELESAFV